MVTSQSNNPGVVPIIQTFLYSEFPQSVFVGYWVPQGGPISGIDLLYSHNLVERCHRDVPTV
jgi:hypothetical protein